MRVKKANLIGGKVEDFIAFRVDTAQGFSGERCQRYTHRIRHRISDFWCLEMTNQ